MNRSLLEAGLDELGVIYNDAQIDTLIRYAEEIELWNRKINLVKASGDQLLIRHVLDSAAGIPRLQEIAPSSVLDAGSGAGFPGIVLAILNPDVRFTLLDKLAKRAAFLRNCVALLALDHCTVYEGDLSSVDDTFDIVCCRAFRPLPVVFQDLARCLTGEGTLMCYKGRRTTIEKELSEISGYLDGYESRLVNLRVPRLQEERHLLLIRGTTR